MTEHTLADVPRGSSILYQVGLLEPVFLEAYRRSEAYARYPDAELLRIPGDVVLDYPSVVDRGDGYLEHHTAWGAGGTPFAAAYRWSNPLQLWIPTEAEQPHFDNGPHGPGEWLACSTADEDAIDSFARSNTDHDLDAVKEAYQQVMRLCSTWSTHLLLTELNRIEDRLNAIADEHENKEFAEVAALFAEWDGDDADHCYEVFGQYLQSALGDHRHMVYDLNIAASGDGQAQAEALCDLYNGVAIEFDKIHEATQAQTSPAAVAAARFIGTVVINRVPYLSDVLAGVDFLFEIGSNGGNVGQSDKWINWLLERTFTSSPSIPTVELCHEVRDSLTGFADGVYDELTGARDTIARDLERNARNWHNKDTCMLIPGHVD